MMSRRRSVVVAVLLGPALAAGLPFIELYLDCRQPRSDPCLWGRSLLPVSVTVSVVFFGTIFALVLFGLFEWRRQRAAAG